MMRAPSCRSILTGTKKYQQSSTLPSIPNTQPSFSTMTKTGSVLLRKRTRSSWEEKSHSRGCSLSEVWPRPCWTTTLISIVRRAQRYQARVPAIDREVPQQVSIPSNTLTSSKASRKGSLWMKTSRTKAGPTLNPVRTNFRRSNNLKPVKSSSSCRTVRQPRS